MHRTINILLNQLETDQIYFCINKLTALVMCGQTTLFGDCTPLKPIPFSSDTDAHCPPRWVKPQARMSMGMQMLQSSQYW